MRMHPGRREDGAFRKPVTLQTGLQCALEGDEAGHEGRGWSLQSLFPSSSRPQGASELLSVRREVTLAAVFSRTWLWLLCGEGLQGTRGRTKDISGVSVADCRVTSHSQTCTERAALCASRFHRLDSGSGHGFFLGPLVCPHLAGGSIRLGGPGCLPCVFGR